MIDKAAAKAISSGKRFALAAVVTIDKTQA
jgi:hypothetical protein